jgi:hypothetical protein
VTTYLPYLIIIVVVFAAAALIAHASGRKIRGKVTPRPTPEPERQVPPYVVTLGPNKGVGFTDLTRAKSFRAEQRARGVKARLVVDGKDRG